MLTGTLNLPGAQPELRQIVDRAQHLIEARDKYVLPEKKTNFERRVKSLQDELRAELLYGEQIQSDAISRFINEITKEVRRSSDGNWKNVEHLCRELWRTNDRWVRRLELQQPSSQEEYLQALMWMVEKGTGEELALIQQARAHPPYTSQEITTLLKTAEQRIFNRMNDTYSTDPQEWVSACDKTRPMGLMQRMALLTEILKSETAQRAALIELAKSRACDSVFRCAAINRLVLVEASPQTVEFLQQLFDPSEPDENLRATAYSAYRYLVSQAGSADGEDPRRKGRSSTQPDPSERMRWLRSLED